MTTQAARLAAFSLNASRSASAVRDVHARRGEIASEQEQKDALAGLALGVVEGIQLPSALAPLLRADLFGARERFWEFYT
jgi:hypothetical protein